MKEGLPELHAGVHESRLSLEQENILLARRVESIAEELVHIKKENEELKKRVIEDDLTGLKRGSYLEIAGEPYVRRASREYALQERRKEQTESGTVSAMMLDLDKFKVANDTLGHFEGDKILTFVADVLRSHIQRPDDIIARKGGDEFAVLLPGTSKEGAAVIAEKIRNDIENGLSKVGVTISIGIAEYALGDDIRDLLERADKALYDAKGAGRNRIATADKPKSVLNAH